MKKNSLYINITLQWALGYIAYDCEGPKINIALPS